MKGLIMVKKADIAAELFKNGYNCSQAVFGAFCEDFGINFNDGIKLASSFGGGMGRLREVCGAVSAMFMLAGIKYGYTSPNDDETKANHYKLIQTLAQYFKDENGSIICRDLLGEDVDGYIPEKRTDEYYSERPCEKCIRDAAEIIQNNLY